MKFPSRHSSASAVIAPESAAIIDDDAAPSKARRSENGVPRWRSIASLLCLLLGIAVLAYPIIATSLGNRAQMQAAEALRESMAKNYQPDQREKILQAAREYNAQLRSGPILDPFLQRVAPDTAIYHEYLRYLNFDGIMGSVRIPKIKVDMPIYHGTDDATLLKGVGHLFGSSLPVGGPSTHAVLTAHSGLGTATMFDNLPSLDKGDAIYISVAGETLKYVVTSTEVVKPTYTDSLQVVKGKDMITLITCTPYGVNSHRLFVHAERAPLPQAEAEKIEQAPEYSVFQLWMIFPVILVIAVVIGRIWIARRRRNPVWIPKHMSTKK